MERDVQPTLACQPFDDHPENEPSSFNRVSPTEAMRHRKEPSLPSRFPSKTVPSVVSLCTLLGLGFTMHSPRGLVDSLCVLTRL